MGGRSSQGVGQELFVPMACRRAHYGQSAFSTPSAAKMIYICIFTFTAYKYCGSSLLIFA
uniref:Predicted protein n=1 Tax=Hordeum vulgare subsp. vulgare TaxID=112509 RepID=F2EI86_HORVV|nr:predicted protein [Hordeum vulgare subsp. vulgare]